MTLRKPAILEHPTPSIPQKDLHPEPVAPLTASERNDQRRRALVQKAFGSSQPVTGGITFAGRNIGRTERQTILQRVLEHGTHRGDVFENDEHTAAEFNGGTFELVGTWMRVEVTVK
jgi:hypothetical protein